MVVDDKLSKVRFRLDRTAHIKVNGQICEHCYEKPCLYVCPVQNYILDDEGCLEFFWQGCVECGACRLMCDKGAISWNFPRGGYGVSWRYG